MKYDYQESSFKRDGPKLVYSLPDRNWYFWLKLAQSNNTGPLQKQNDYCYIQLITTKLGRYPCTYGSSCYRPAGDESLQLAFLAILDFGLWRTFLLLRKKKRSSKYRGKEVHNGVQSHGTSSPSSFSSGPEARLLTSYGSVSPDSSVSSSSVCGFTWLSSPLIKLGCF